MRSAVASAGRFSSSARPRRSAARWRWLRTVRSDRCSRRAVSAALHAHSSQASSVSRDSAGTSAGPGEAPECVRDELLGGGRAAPHEGLHGHVLVADSPHGPAQGDLEGEQRLLVTCDEPGDSDGRLADADPSA